MVCLVTGSSRGLGRAAALAFAGRGHRVVIHYNKSRNDADEVASHTGESLVLQSDVKNFDAVKSLVREVIDKWGRIDVLVNNAGITREALMIKTSENDFDEMMNTNLKGPLNFTLAVVPYMMNHGGGHIINVSSYAGIKGKEGLAAYSASKAGLIGLTKTAARELSGYNIWVNAVLPGYMLTGMGTGASEKAKEAALRDNLLNAFSEPDSIAEFICTLSEMKGTTGQVFNLDGRVI